MAAFIAAVIGVIHMFLAPLIGASATTTSASLVATTTSTQQYSYAQVEKLAADNDQISNLRTSASVLQQYHSTHTAYPQALTDLVTNGEMTEADGTIIEGVISEVFTGVQYRTFDGAKHYVLWTTLAVSKQDHGFPAAGVFGPVASDTNGVSCSDQFTYCLTDPASAASTAVENENVTVDTSSWKTYTDPSVGISFKYPEDFTTGTSSGPEATGAIVDQPYIYNYLYKFYPGYTADGTTTRGLTEYGNFELSFAPYSVGPDDEPYINFAKLEKIGDNTYTEVDMQNGGHGERFFLTYPGSKNYVQIVYDPTIDVTDIGGLAIQPDYVAGVQQVMKDPGYLDAAMQVKILYGVLASVKLTSSAAAPTTSKPKPKPVPAQEPVQAASAPPTSALTPETYPSLLITSPAGGASAIAGQPIDIAWQGSNTVPGASVSISYSSCDHGCSATNVVSGLPPTGTYDSLALPAGSWYISLSLLPSVDGFTPGGSSLVIVH